MHLASGSPCILSRFFFGLPQVLPVFSADSVYSSFPGSPCVLSRFSLCSLLILLRFSLCSLGDLLRFNPVSLCILSRLFLVPRPMFCPSSPQIFARSSLCYLEVILIFLAVCPQVLLRFSLCFLQIVLWFSLCFLFSPKIVHRFTPQVLLPQVLPRFSTVSFQVLTRFSAGSVNGEVDSYLILIMKTFYL